jgi:copper resistance protein D
MILEYLQPDPSFLDGVAVVLRALYYVASIGAAGLVFFMIGYGHRLRPTEVARLRRTLLGAIAAGLALSVAALALRVLVLLCGSYRLPPSGSRSIMWCAVQPVVQGSRRQRSGGLCRNLIPLSYELH